ARLHVPGGQVIEDVVAEDDRLPEHRVRWVPVVDVRLEGVDDRVLLRLSGRCAWKGEPQDDEEGSGEPECARHEVLLVTSSGCLDEPEVPRDRWAIVTREGKGVSIDGRRRRGASGDRRDASRS